MYYMTYAWQKVSLCLFMTLLLLSGWYFIVLAPHILFASEISNTISVSSSSGGNSAQNGEVVEGKSTISVYIETTVDGETVELIDEAITSDGSGYSRDSLYIEKETYYESENDDEAVRVVTAVVVEVDSAQSDVPSKHNVYEESMEESAVYKAALLNSSTEEDSGQKDEDAAAATVTDSDNVGIFSGVLSVLSHIFTYVFSFFKV